MRSLSAYGLVTPPRVARNPRRRKHRAIVSRGAPRLFPDPLILALAAPAALFAGISKGGFANGPTFVATPLLAAVTSPAEAAALMLPMLMVMDATAVRAYRRVWDARIAGRLILAAVPGMALGALLFRGLEAGPLQVALGLLALGFVAYQGARWAGWLRTPPVPERGWAPWICGGTLGFTSFVIHAGGPPAAVYLLSRGLEKRVYQATTVAIFAAVNAIKFVVYAALGLFTAEIAVSVLALAPVAVAGTLLGVWAHARVPGRAFFALAYVLLAAAGVHLVVTGL